MAMETITQTNRTILFTEINPERLNLLTLIGDVRGKSSLDDDKMKEINEELLVSSFEEFLERFNPVVYSWCDAATGSIQYSLVKPENIPQNCITEIPLNESNDLLNMLITLMSARDAQGVANVDFQFSNILEMISPRKSWTISVRSAGRFSILTASMWSWTRRIPSGWIWAIS